MTYWTLGHLLFGLVLLGATMPLSGEETNEKSEVLNVSNWFTRGTLAEETGDTTTALKHYQEAIAQFDSDRKLAAEALLRIAASYQVLGASESSDAAYLRVAREFADLVDIQERVPAKFKSPSSAPIESDILAAVEQLVAAGAVGPQNGPPPGADLSLDPIQEESRLFLESCKQRVERSRARRDEAHDQYQDAEIRLMITRSSRPSALPDTVRPGPIYEALKSSFHMLSSGGNEATEKRRIQEEEKIVEWVNRAFVPALKAELDGAQLNLETLKIQYEKDLHRYQEALREVREREKAEAEKRADQARRTRQPLVIMGKVRKPGYYELPGGQVSMIEAIAMAGGFLENSKKRGIRISRGGNTHQLNFDDELELSPDDRFLLKKGDVITVPERLF